MDRFKGITIDAIYEEVRQMPGQDKHKLITDMSKSLLAKKTDRQWTAHWHQLALSAQADIDRVKRINGLE